MHRLGVTLVRRICAFCGEPNGFRLWRWSGSLFVTTHTLCARCSLERTLLAREPARGGSRA